MLVPEMLCGDTKTVTAACRRHITRYKRGGSWVDAGPMVDVSEAPGLVMLDGPSPLLGGSNIRLYAPFRELHNVFVREQIKSYVGVSMNTRAFDAAIEHEWSLLGLLSQTCYDWVQDAERAERFLKAIMRRWDEIDGVGRRYTRGEQHGKSFWEIPHMLKYVLAHRGVPQPRLVEPLPPGGIAALLPAKN